MTKKELSRSEIEDILATGEMTNIKPFKKEKRKWEGTQPTRCQVCDGVLEEVFYDADIGNGMWALICHACWQFHNGSLGTGIGQKYSLTTFEKLGG